MNRRQQIAQNIRPPHKPVTGGVSAPQGSAKSPTFGLGGRRAAPNPGQLGQKRGLPAAPQGAPQPGAAPQGGGPVMPWDLAAANDEAGAQKRLSNTLTGLDAGWLRTQQEFGLEGPWADAASNPFSRSALLQRSYDNAKSGSLNSAGQQLYSGSYVNAQNANTHQFNLGRDELQKAYGQAHAGYIGERQGAQDAFNESMNQAGWDRVNAGLEAPLEPAPASGGGQPRGRKQQIKQNLNNKPTKGGTRKVR